MDDPSLPDPQNFNCETKIQRAALPRILEGDPDPPVKVQPPRVLLREGLDRAPAAALFRARRRGLARLGCMLPPVPVCSGWA
jgi:hypothetical protein